MKSILITGGAGFIGVNSADYFASKGWKIVVLDDLSRRGADNNLVWLQQRHAIIFIRCDIRDAAAVKHALNQAQPNVVLHLAAQVAVTSSVVNPRKDFEINALGTLNVLEAVRLVCPAAFFINASTNKVFGALKEVAVTERNGRYEYENLPKGVASSQQLDFHSPYGCSKGAADQYTIDYSRIYGLKTTTFRQSCIYGTRQFGIEDQGWVAWFTIAAVLGKPITIYGNGKQTRDVLFVGDLIRAYEAAIDYQESAIGRAFNIGGGPANILSLLELLAYLEAELAIDIPLKWDDWRPGDQPVFVCDISDAEKVLNWRPKTSVEHGVKTLIHWVRENSELFT